MIRYICSGCKTPLETPDNQAGKIVKCPKCELIHQAPAPPQRSPEYIRVQLSAQIVQWPQKCVCCCEESDTLLRLMFTKQTRSGVRERFWEAPYCSACLSHVQGTPKTVRKRTCAGTGAAVIYDGYQGWVHTFRFRNPDYARRFIAANDSKILNRPS